MSNVQWKDPARRAHRLTPIETEAGRHRIAWSIQEDLSRDAGPKPSMVPHGALARRQRFHGNDHHC
jgi:hypothetical protein